MLSAIQKHGVHDGAAVQVGQEHTPWGGGIWAKTPILRRSSHLKILRTEGFRKRDGKDIGLR